MTHTFRICRSGRPKENVVCPKKTWHFSEEALSLSDHTTGRPAGYVYPSDRRPLVTTYSLVANMFLKWIHISIRTICVPHQDLIYVQFYCYQYSMLHCQLGSECFPKIFPFAYGSCIWRGVCVCVSVCVGMWKVLIIILINYSRVNINLAFGKVNDIGQHFVYHCCNNPGPGSFLAKTITYKCVKKVNNVITHRIYWICRIYRIYGLWLWLEERPTRHKEGLILFEKPQTLLWKIYLIFSVE